MTYKKLKTNFERELLFQIIQNLRKEKLTHDKAQSLAKEFLPLLKAESSEEFIKSLAKLAETHNEILEAYLIAVKDYEKESVEEGLDTVRKSLKVEDPPELPLRVQSLADINDSRTHKFAKSH